MKIIKEFYNFFSYFFLHYYELSIVLNFKVYFKLFATFSSDLWKYYISTLFAMLNGFHGIVSNIKC